MEIFLWILLVGLLAKYLSYGGSNVQVVCKLHIWEYKTDGMYCTACKYKAGSEIE